MQLRQRSGQAGEDIDDIELRREIPRTGEENEIAACGKAKEENELAACGKAKKEKELAACGKTEKGGTVFRAQRTTGKSDANPGGGAPPLRDRH